MSSKTLFLTAAIAGAFAGAAGVSSTARACGDDGAGATQVQKMGCPGKDKASCKGKADKDKASCKSKDKADKGSSDKAACSGKHGCGSKTE